MNKRFLTLSVVTALATAAMAQSSTESPYSQFGMGVLADKGGSYNKAMNGLGIALHQSNGVNPTNPASYSSIDSLTFLFDMGMSGQFSNFKEGNLSKNAQTASFDYAYGAFRLFKNVGMAFGIRPFSNVGYSYYNTSTIATDANEVSASTTTTNTYSGEGGLHEIFLGIGVRPFRYLSLGVEGGYLWGTTTRTISNAYSDSYINTLTKSYTMKINTFSINAGMQVMLPVNKRDELTLGVTYGLGHKMNSDVYCDVISTNSVASTSDTTQLKIGDDMKLPQTIGVGLAYSHANQWMVGVDYSLQKWGSIDYPVYSGTTTNGTYSLQSGQLKDRHKMTVGAQLVPNAMDRRFWKRIRYSLGFSYATPYIKINGNDGPKEISGTLGFGIPISNNYNNRSRLNISAQYVRTSASNMITENMLRINIGLTFNENWFAKWKVN